ncbi:MAG: hypothetical protein E6772_04955 [Dysgonomonas sp.]|nr:hypothetical protein [Dysgonomonas sp.]
MYKLCLIMLIVSIVGLVLNLAMRFFYGDDPNSFKRSLAFVIFGFSSYYLMKYYKSKRK